MHRLIEFLRAKRHWFLLFLLEAVALALLFNGSFYTRALNWYATNTVGGFISESISQVNSYLRLRSANEQLLSQYAQLKHRYSELERQVQDAMAQGTLPRLSILDSSTVRAEGVITARIISRTHQTGNTYYTINKGERDGIQADMAVMSATGVVGTVMSTSAYYALVIPISNTKLRLSCTVASKGFSGTLYTDPTDGSLPTLGNIPAHARLAKGDTVLTSGFSYLFPEGMMVGTIAESIPSRTKGSAGSFANYPMNFATNFETLRYVYVVLKKVDPEVRQLEATVQPNE